MLARPEAVEAFENSLLSRGRSAGTAHKYAALLAGFTAHAANDGDNLDAALTSWINEARRSGAAASTVKLRLAASRAFCRWAGVPTDALDDYSAPTPPEPVAHPLANGSADLTAMLRHASGHDAHVIALGGYSGLRVNESVSVTVGSIDAARDELVVVGKGGRTRRIPVSAALRPYLEEMRIPSMGAATAAERDVMRLVPISNSGARARITRVANAAGVRNVAGLPASSHDLRMTFATEVYAKTKDIFMVQTLLGHKDVKTTQAYIGIKASEKKMAVEF